MVIGLSMTVTATERQQAARASSCSRQQGEWGTSPGGVLHTEQFLSPSCRRQGAGALHAAATECLARPRPS